MKIIKKKLQPNATEEIYLFLSRGLSQNNNISHYSCFHCMICRLLFMLAESPTAVFRLEECPAWWSCVWQRGCAWLAEIHLSAAQVGEGVSTQGPAFRTMTAIVTSSDCRRATHREEESPAQPGSCTHTCVHTHTHSHTPRQHTRFIYSAALTSASMEIVQSQFSVNTSVNICQGCSWLSFVWSLKWSWKDQVWTPSKIYSRWIAVRSGRGLTST